MLMGFNKRSKTDNSSSHGVEQKRAKRKKKEKNLMSPQHDNKKKNNNKRCFDHKSSLLFIARMISDVHIPGVCGTILSFPSDRIRP